MIANNKRRCAGCGSLIAPLRLTLSLFSVFCLLSVIAWTLSATSAMAASPPAEPPQPPTISGVRVGLADRYKAGLWTQVKVTLRGGSEPASGEVAVIVPDNDGVPICIATPENAPCSLTPGDETTVTLVTRFGRVNSDMTVEFRDNGIVAARRTFTTSSCADGEHFLPAVESQRLVVSIGPTSLGAEELTKLQGIEQEQRPVVARLDSVAELPRQWNAYEGVDAVIFSTSQPNIYDALTKDDARLDALEQWIRMGGRVVLSVGSHGEEVLGRESPIARFAPGRFEKTETLKQGQAAALEIYCGSTSPVLRAGNVQMTLRAARLSAVDGVIESREADLPLVVRTAWGFGQVIFVAADLDTAPLSDWVDRPRFLARLLDISVGRSEESDENRVIMHYGYNDLAGQLRSALDQFAGIGIASFSLVAGLIVLYILLIGPGDYFFLRRVVRRMTWTWFTFPLVVVLASGGVLYLSKYLKGTQPRLNQVDLVDVDAKSGFVRGTMWANLFSPRLDTFDLSLEPKGLSTVANLPEPKSDASAPDARVLLSWFGLTGSALGGMSPRTGSVSLWTEPCTSPSPQSMYGMPVQVGATKSFTGRWIAATDVVPKATLTDEAGILAGTVVNTLNFPLEQCILAHGLSVYEIGTIAPNGSFHIDGMTKRSELKTLLTGRKVIASSSGEKYRQEATPFDQSSTDLSYVLRMMMFYRVGGGRRYVGLLNEYQNFVDISSLLKTDRAVLIAQTPANAKTPREGAQLLCNGKQLDDPQDKHLTVYRFVFPVKKGKGR